jgi:Mce-associated membrane protein
MAKTNESATDSATDSATSRAEMLALAEEAEAEAAEAEALAAAARARARAARLRREAQALAETAEAAETDTTEPAERSEVTEVTEVIEAEEPEDAEEAEETVEAETPAEATETAEVEKPADDKKIKAKVAKPKVGRATRRRRLPLPTAPTTAKVGAILLIIGFTAFGGFAAWKHHESDQRHKRSEAFKIGATQGVINLTSLDFKKAKDDVQRVIDSSTGQFRDDFAQRANDFAKVVEETKVVTEGKVSAAAVESMDDHSAVVLILATSRITNSAGAQDEPRIFRLRVSVTEEGGQYRMSKVEFVP